ncbi:MAG: BON domain-containing protein [Terriglobales bacterium]
MRKVVEVIPMKGFSKKIAAGMLAAVMATGATAFADTATPSTVQQQVAQKLQKKSQFADVSASAENGVVTLQGTVKTYADKLAAEKTARKVDHVSQVRDEIAVSGPAVSDTELQQQVAKKLRYVGFDTGTQVFDNFQVGVRDGVVTVIGETYQPMDKQDALEEVARIPGVKGVVDQVKVAPVSNFDDEIRLRLVRAIYGGGSLAYGLDPAAPIRIVVDDGHVGLYGFVTSQVDKAVAGVRAAQTFGVFGVQNHLQTPQDQAR